MVQICSECNEKHINSAETMTDKSSDTVKSLNFGNGGGRFSPSDSKSQANSDSSYVRFKVNRKNNNNNKKLRFFSTNFDLLIIQTIAVRNRDDALLVEPRSGS